MFCVKLNNKGRTMRVTVPAYTQKGARDLAEYQYTGYKAISAQRIS